MVRNWPYANPLLKTKGAIGGPSARSKPEQNSLPLEILPKREENPRFRPCACLLGFLLTAAVYLAWIY